MSVLLLVWSMCGSVLQLALVAVLMEEARPDDDDETEEHLVDVVVVVVEVAGLDAEARKWCARCSSLEHLQFLHMFLFEAKKRERKKNGKIL